MSLVRPAAGGESCKAGFFLVEYSGRPAKKQRRFKAVNVTEEQKRKGSRDDSADRLRLLSGVGNSCKYATFHVAFHVIHGVYELFTNYSALNVY